MDSMQRLKRIWGQTETPVLLRRGGVGEKLRLRFPESDGGIEWLFEGKQPWLYWWCSENECWEVPKAWLNHLVERLLTRFGRLYVVQPYREQEKCAPACQNAKGHECNCSCMGANHGAGNDGSWFEVSDAFSTRWKDRQLACRLMVAQNVVDTSG